MVLNIYRYLHGVGILDMDPLWATSFVTMYHFLRHFGWGGLLYGTPETLTKASNCA